MTLTSVSHHLGPVCLWDLRTGQAIRRFEVGGECADKAFSPDGKFLATVDSPEPIRLWDTASGKGLRSFGGGWCLAFSPDGKILASGDDQGLLRLWDVAAGKEIRRFNIQPFGVDKILFSPDGKTFASVNRDQENGVPTVFRWGVSTGEQLPGIGVPPDCSITCLAFSPDGRVLALGDHDSTIRLWEVSTGKERGRLQGHRGPVLALTFSGDGKRLISGSRDSTALVWDLNVWARLGRQEAGGLSEQQLEGLWHELKEQDPAKAYRAIWMLAAAPAPTTAFLRPRLHAVPSADPERLARLLADLDARRSTVRDRATAELETFGEVAELALVASLKSKPSPEVRRRVEQLLAKLKKERQVPSPERLRALRSLEVLELIGTAEAREVLKGVAGGAAEARLTQDAKAALGRLARRSHTPL
jgi:dipeptidyl aminopeptidase/acylaminoacyl peptidase